MAYTYNNTEEYTGKLLKSHGILTPSQLTPELIAEALNINLGYLPVRSWRVDDYIILDSRLPSTVQWEEFGHELCHALWHPDNQFHLTKSYIEYQENQADNFAYFACVPTFMLLEMELPESACEAVREIAKTFNVTPEFATKRLEFHMNKLYSFSS